MALDGAHFAFALAVTEDTGHLGSLEQSAGVIAQSQRWLSSCWR